MSQSRITRNRAILVAIVVLGASGAAAAVMRDHWLPEVQKLIGKKQEPNNRDRASGGHGHSHGPGGHSHGDDSHAGHSHGDEKRGGHSHSSTAPGHAHADDKTTDEGLHSLHSHAPDEEVNALELSAVAWKNIGLKTAVVKPRSFAKAVSAPAMVIERAGRSQVNVAAPLTGIVTRVFPIEGEAVEPGQRLFELRLTHEDLVTAQRDFLRSAQELDVVQREIARLKTVGDGVVAGRRIIEQEYERQKVEAALHAQRQGLLLHGMQKEQIDQIIQTRKLLAILTVRAPEFDDDADDHGLRHIYHVQSIPVKRGQSVSAGESLALLADHCVLYIEGQAFEADAPFLLAAARSGVPVRVSLGAEDVPSEDGGLSLPILYLGDHFELDSHTQSFYIRLTNKLIRDEKKGDHRFVSWRFRPGQRMSIHIPMGQGWENQIVVSPDAVATDGAESYVFVEAKDHFDRVAVHVLFRDRNAVVIENDGQLIGKRLAISGAYQMHLAIKNRVGGAAAAHGHTH